MPFTLFQLPSPTPHAQGKPDTNAHVQVVFYQCLFQFQVLADPRKRPGKRKKEGVKTVQVYFIKLPSIVAMSMRLKPRPEET